VQVQTVRLTTMRDDATNRIIVEGQRDLLAAFQARDAVAASDRMLRFVIEGEQAFRAIAS
jgi:DNA-binding FadR family transcriptional regulator